jgi:myo-inositol-1(or 4)-monophosphatase
MHLSALEEHLAAARRGVRAAGSALLAAPDSWRTADGTRGRDVKLRADREAEALILAELRGSGLPVLSEEAGADADFAAAEWAWIVDPLDGTFNYQRAFPMWCVSVALLRRSVPVAGLIFDPTSSTVIEGGVDRGVSEDGQPLRVSQTAETHQAVLATGFPVGRDYAPEALAGFVTQVREFKKIRMIGSAARSLLAVARGQFDAYYEENISLWDVAAGIALVRAAGGDARVARPGPAHQVTVYASNGRLRPLFADSL